MRYYPTPALLVITVLLFTIILIRATQCWSEFRTRWLFSSSVFSRRSFKAARRQNPGQRFFSSIWPFSWIWSQISIRPFIWIWPQINVSYSPGWWEIFTQVTIYSRVLIPCRMQIAPRKRCTLHQKRSYQMKRILTNLYRTVAHYQYWLLKAFVTQ